MTLPRVGEDVIMINLNQVISFSPLKAGRTFLRLRDDTCFTLDIDFIVLRDRLVQMLDPQ